MLKTNVNRCIEKILKKAKRNFTYTNDYNKIYIKGNNAIIINPHYCYIMNQDKIKSVDPGFIASEKEKNLCKCIVEKKKKKVIPDGKPADKITINYRDALELKHKEMVNKYGLNYVKLEGNNKVIFIVLENLLHAFRIFQNEELTLQIFNNYKPYSLYDH